jgi:TPR repeat protein
LVPFRGIRCIVGLNREDVAMLGRSLAGIAVAMMLAGRAAAGPFEDGAAAYLNGDYATALQFWKPLAASGHERAQFRVGLLYDSGLGVAQDYLEAARWFRLAADQGAADAEANLGFIYLEGKGVSQDFFEAAKWFQRAADRGAPDAQFYLGYLYANGWGVPLDYDLAEKWYRRAAEQGFAEV